MLARPFALGTIVFAITAPAAALANDSALAYGGTPRPLTGHPTISMMSEVVKIEIGERDSIVDCRFEFVNHGPACRVRMGFPDQGRGAADPDEEGEHNPPTGTFKAFASWVNGVKVKTSVARAAHSGNFWHVKVVEFPPDSTVGVRDRYRVEVGSSVGFHKPFSIHDTSYILHTGASWHGPIGRSEIIVTFKRSGVRAPLETHLLRRSGKDDDPNYVSDERLSRRSVYYAGPSKPESAGNTLRFIRTNWTPSERDDISLVFDMGPVKTRD